MKIFSFCKYLKYGLFSFIFLTFTYPVYAGNDSLNEEIVEPVETRLGTLKTSSPPLSGTAPSPVEENNNDDSNTNTSRASQLSTTPESQQPIITEAERALTVITGTSASLRHQTTMQQIIDSLRRNSHHPYALSEFFRTPAGRFIFQQISRTIMTEVLSSIGLPIGIPSLPWAINPQSLRETPSQGETQETLSHSPRSLVISLPLIPNLSLLSFTILDPQENRRALGYDTSPIAEEEKRNNILFSSQKAAFDFAYKISELCEQYHFLTFIFFIFYFIKIFH